MWSAERDEIARVLADLASDLANDNHAGFLRTFDAQWEGFEELRRNVVGLLAVWDLSSSVEIRGVVSEGNEWSADVDWYLQMKSRSELRSVQQRRQTLRLRLAKMGKRWRVKTLDAPEFFRPED